MIRNMRRLQQLLPYEDCISILKKGTSGVLAVLGDDEYPYTVPLSYVYHNDRILFHSAISGHKVDAIIKNNKASFCVIDQDIIVPEKYTTCYRSVIAFGKVRILNKDTEKRSAIELLTEKYSPDHTEGGQKEIEQAFSRFCMIELTIEHMTGKEAMELVQARNQP